MELLMVFMLGTPVLAAVLFMVYNIGRVNGFGDGRSYMIKQYTLLFNQELARETERQKALSRQQAANKSYPGLRLL